MVSNNLRNIPTFVKNAVIDTFSIQASVNAQLIQMSLSSDGFFNNVECRSIVQFESSDFSGSLSLGVSNETLLKILEKMLGETFPAVTPEIADGLAELLNIIYGSSRKNINEDGFDFKPAIPQTFIGDSAPKSEAKASQIFLLFQSDVGPFYVSLSLGAKAAP